MIGASRPPADDDANYAHVAALRMDEKGEARPMALMPKVFDQYKAYVARATATAGAVPDAFSREDNAVLGVNADYLDRAHFNSLRSAILGAVHLKKCPYCYRIRASEVDHYLPKSHFGEYAVYAPNLVPICRDCNGKKSNRYKRPEGGRRYIHPYFDPLPISSTPYLAAKLSVGTSVTVSFHIRSSPELSDELREVLTNQFSDLDLGTRYVEEATQTMTSMLYSLYTHYSRGGAEEVRYQLAVEKRSRERTFGPNHWWPVLLGVLAESQEFCAGGFAFLDGGYGLVVGFEGLSG
jgi:hypothetical protein